VSTGGLQQAEIWQPWRPFGASSARLDCAGYSRARSASPGTKYVTPTPEDGVLAVHLRRELTSMLELRAYADMQSAPEDISSEALCKIKMVAGTCISRARHSLSVLV
jgi:hypothetical protein